MSVESDVLATQLLQMGEMLGLLASTVAGYRAQLVAAGFGETAAEQMAVDWHREWARKLMDTPPGSGT